MAGWRALNPAMRVRILLPQPLGNLWRHTSMATVKQALFAAALVALFLFSFTSFARAQDNLQQQIYRLQTELDRLQYRFEQSELDDYRVRIDGFSRLSAIEREVELNRNIIYGMASGMAANIAALVALLKRAGQVYRAVNGKNAMNDK